MRIILKILAAPFLLALSLLVALLLFALDFSEGLLRIVAGLLAVGGVALILGLGQVFNGCVILFLAFLISPYGLPALALLGTEKLYDLKDNLRDFLAS